VFASEKFEAAPLLGEIRDYVCLSLQDQRTVGMVAFAIYVTSVFDDAYADPRIRLKSLHFAAFGGTVEPKHTRLPIPSEVYCEKVRLVFQAAGDRHDPYRCKNLLNLSWVVKCFLGASKVISFHAKPSF
jgi:hypothetical protein